MEYFISLLLIWKGEHLKSSWLKYLAPLSVLEHMVNENQIYFARIVLSKLFDCKYNVIDFLSVWSKWPIATTANIKTKKKKKKLGIFRNKIVDWGVLPSLPFMWSAGPHKLKLKKKPSLKKGVSKTHSKMDDPSLELLISDMTVHI